MSRTSFATVCRKLLLVLAVGVTVAVVGGCTDDAGESTGATTTVEEPLERLRVIFPEGFNVVEMGERVAAVRRIAIEKRGATPRLTRKGYLRAAAAAIPPRPFRRDWKRGSIEGFLFPAVYDFTRKTTPRELVADQLKAFRQRFATLRLKEAKSKNLTPYDVLKIASMIEKETVVPRERALVAAVIYNRLRNRMPLGIDATLRYGLDIPGTESLTKAAIRSDNPFNSRRFPGLPPTPVANPGLASLRAAANPANVDYLYYVRVPGTKRHFFTASESEFLRKVCEYGYACN